MEVPEHDVLVGGFPCQPFSKSGLQQGMDEARGTLFWNIAKIIEVRKPKLVLLENVRNISGPRHRHEWDVIIRTLRQNGYRVSETPFIISPHRIHPEFGGRPQVRERVLIAATRIPKGPKKLHEEPGIPDLTSVTSGWSGQLWNLETHLPLEKLRSKSAREKVSLTPQETKWIDAWEDFVQVMRTTSPEERLPGFPLWVDSWVHERDLQIPVGTPKWKEDFLRKNSNFYTKHKKVLDKWLKRWNGLSDFPASRRKFEWQAQDFPTLWGCVMHFRPSGIRAKKPTYVPALVAITQTSIVGKHKRRLSVREGARLQGFPEWLDFLDQPESLSFKQLGNAVNVSVIYHALRSQVVRDITLLNGSPSLVKSILSAPINPDLVLNDSGFAFRKGYGQPVEDEYGADLRAAN